jgi:hypothetical protein
MASQEAFWDARSLAYFSKALIHGENFVNPVSPRCGRRKPSHESDWAKSEIRKSETETEGRGPRWWCRPCRFRDSVRGDSVSNRIWAGPPFSSSLRRPAAAPTLWLGTSQFNGHRRMFTAPASKARCRPRDFRRIDSRRRHRSHRPIEFAPCGVILVVSVPKRRFLSTRPSGLHEHAAFHEGWVVWPATDRRDSQWSYWMHQWGLQAMLPQEASLTGS